MFIHLIRRKQLGFSAGLILRLISEIKTFGKNHPRMAGFIDKEFFTDLPVGTKVEIKVTRPGKEEVSDSFITVSDDSKLLKDLKELS